ncbi:hypothetical protein LSUCC0031_12050 [Rhodobacterales bacterium LSUCC0031]|nr:hypothetical protein [Rhodobacterales bacterium LSUCC0031]
MNFDNLDQFSAVASGSFGKGPAAMLIAEDNVEVASSIGHLRSLGFRQLFVLAAPDLEVAPLADDIKLQQHVIRAPTRAPGITQTAMNTLIDKMPGEWLHYCYNGEYLFYPFCEDRSVGEMVNWVMEERRSAIMTYVIDLYAADLRTHSNAVSLDGAMLDASGYYAEGRSDSNGHAKDRQLNFYGGLRWRFEEHVAKPKRKIDRIALFQARPGLRLNEDHTLSDEEMNTFACPWHNSLTATLCSFRVAKALRTNPGSRHDIHDFRWHNSTQFHWSSLQLMELGLMEPGQWF